MENSRWKKHHDRPVDSAGTEAQGPLSEVTHFADWSNLADMTPAQMLKARVVTDDGVALVCYCLREYSAGRECSATQDWEEIWPKITKDADLRAVRNSWVRFDRAVRDVEPFYLSQASTLLSYLKKYKEFLKKLSTNELRMIRTAVALLQGYNALWKKVPTLLYAPYTKSVFQQIERDSKRLCVQCRKYASAVDSDMYEYWFGTNKYIPGFREAAAFSGIDLEAEDPFQGKDFDSFTPILQGFFSLLSLRATLNTKWHESPLLKHFAYVSFDHLVQTDPQYEAVRAPTPLIPEEMVTRWYKGVAPPHQQLWDHWQGLISGNKALTLDPWFDALASDLFPTVTKSSDTYALKTAMGTMFRTYLQDSISFILGDLPSQLIPAPWIEPIDNA